MCTRLEIPAVQLPDIETALHHEKDPRVVRWLLGIRLMAKGQTPHDIAPQLDTTERSVRNWAHRFLTDGLAGMRRHPAHGHPPRLSPEEEERFKERLRQGPTAADEVCTWRGHSVIRMLQREFGVSYKPSGVYDMPHRLGFSSLMPRAPHPESSREAQERFQKKRCPAR